MKVLRKGRKDFEGLYLKKAGPKRAGKGGAGAKAPQATAAAPSGVHEGQQGEHGGGGIRKSIQKMRELAKQLGYMMGGITEDYTRCLIALERFSSELAHT